MSLYFNEIYPYAAQWLRNLWPEATVDERSIADVQATDLLGFDRVHLFGGIGGWEYALRLADWPEGRPVWTGSCPCQPFSAAGRRKGTKDKRHLWPEMRRLIAECRPATVFGEQVASRLGREWYAGVRDDLEELGYAVGAADLCAAGTGQEAEGRIVRGGEVSYERIVVGVPHIRQRLFWVAQSRSLSASESRGELPAVANGRKKRKDAGVSGVPNHLADVPLNGRRQGHQDGRGEYRGIREEGDRGGPANDFIVGRLGHAVGEGPQGCGAGIRGGPVDSRGGEPPGSPGGSKPVGDTNGQSGPERNLKQKTGLQTPFGADASRSGFWSAFDIVHCSDGKARRVEPGSFPLVDGLPFRLADGRTREAVSRASTLRGIGNAIVPQVAATFIKAFMETL